MSSRTSTSSSTHALFFPNFALAKGALFLIYYFAMGQQLRKRAKRNRRKAYNKRVHARLLAAKKTN